MPESKLEWALWAAEQGFWVFRLIEDSKLPAIRDYTNRATRDAALISLWWDQHPNANIGIITSKFGDNEALLVADLDKKGDVDGFETARRLEAEGKCFSDTLTQATASSGCHFIYRVRQAVRQSVGAIGRGIDVRSRGGYIVGPGSTLQGRAYTLRGGSLCDAPAWLVAECGNAPAAKLSWDETELPEINQDLAWNRALEYLEKAPVAISGNGGNQTTFQVACALRDFGLTPFQTDSLLTSNWNPRCEPPWPNEELTAIINHAYKYGQNPPGNKAPEVIFKDLSDASMSKALDKDPVENLNTHNAFITIGSGHFILNEAVGPDGRHKIDLLNEATFHRKYAAVTLCFGDKTVPVTKLWMNHPKRRSYAGLVFKPGQEAPPGFYNLWRGFSVEPIEGEANHESLTAFLSHTLENVCQGDTKLFGWLVGYFAHLIQKPYEKPLTALVFRGKKGVGKNALVDRVGHLLGGHYLVTSDRRYLIGNFNSHLENCLLFTLDEAFWSGDKAGEGVLKGLITGQKHNIERKGVEPYPVDNCTRVVILGNEDWLVPASHDERRYAVFQVGDGRKQDRKFFHDMRVGMEQGGYRHLLKYLLDFDLSEVDVNEAPLTDALKEQKEESLDVAETYWFSLLQAGQINDTDWPSEVLCEKLRDGYRLAARTTQSRRQLLSAPAFGKKLKEFCPKISHRQKRNNALRYWVYTLPPLEEARQNWEDRMGYKITWETICE